MESEDLDSRFIFDDEVGLYYDILTGFHLDTHTQIYHNLNEDQCFIWDNYQQNYYLLAISSSQLFAKQRRTLPKKKTKEKRKKEDDTSPIDRNNSK